MPHLDDLIEEKAVTDSGFAIAYALLRLADAHIDLATQFKFLGEATEGVAAAVYRISDKMDP